MMFVIFQLFLKFLYKLIFLYCLFRFFNFDQRMLMIDFFLTSTAEVEVITQYTLISDTYDSKIILTVRTNRFVNYQLSSLDFNSHMFLVE